MLRDAGKTEEGRMALKYLVRIIENGVASTEIKMIRSEAGLGAGEDQKFSFG